MTLCPAPFFIRSCCLTALLGAAVSAHAQMQVQVAPVVTAPLTESLPLSGSVSSPRSSSLAPQESGLVLRMMADEGDAVAAGDVLLELDPELARLELQRLEAERQQAQLLHQEAERLAEEGRRLIADANIPRSLFDSRLADAAAAEQALRQLEVQVRIQAVRVERYQLRAPFAGVIGAKYTELGQWLTAGDSAFDLVQLDPLRIQARIPERYFSQVQPGSPVTITLDALPGRRIKARVDRIVPVSDGNTRSFSARSDAPNPDLAMAPGMSAIMIFTLGDGGSAPAMQVPADAIVRRADGSTEVWVVREQAAVPVRVRTGRRSSSGLVEVMAGDLRADDLAITLGNESLQPGQPVTAVPAPQK